MTLDQLIAKIKDDNPDVRTEAWLGAGEVGAPAMQPMAKLVAEGELEVGRAAKRAMWKIVRVVGAPDAKGKEAVVKELLTLLGDDQPAAVRREALWMISELGCCHTVDPVVKVLANKELREDARCCLERIPDDEAVAALEAALESVPDDFKINIAQSLRARGVAVSEDKYPCQKMVPTKQTAVKPVGR